MNESIMPEVSIPPLSNLTPATKRKKVSWEQDSDWIAMNEPVSIAHEESNKVESVAQVQQSRNCLVQSPPSVLPRTNSEAKEPRADTDMGKIIDKEGSFDSEICITSGPCQRKVHPDCLGSSKND